MKKLIVVISVLIFSVGAQARNNKRLKAYLSDAALVASVNKVVDELEDFDHSDKALKSAYYQTRVIYKLLNRRGTQPPHLPNVEAEEILEVLSYIIDDIENRRHSWGALVLVRLKLLKIMVILKRNRVVNTGQAMLVVDGNDPFNFGRIFTGSEANISFNVTNTGDADATIIGETGLAAPFQFRGGVAYPGIAGTCGAVIEAGETCQISLESAPTEVGDFNGQFMLQYNDGQEVQVLTKGLVGAAI